MKPSFKPIISPVWNDKHTNSTVGLCPPSFELDDGGSAVVSKWQQWIWNCWLDFIEQVKAEIVATPGAQVIGFENGDSVDVDAKERSDQFVTRNHIDAVEMAREVDEPLVNLLDRFYLIRGTGAHEGRSSQYAKQLAKALSADKYDGQIAPWYWLGDLSGVRVEITHHAMGGFRKASTAAGAMTRLAEETVMEYAENHDPIPALVLRGHVHRFADSYDNVTVCRAITNGAWQLHTDHSHRSGYGPKLSHIGGLIIKYEAGRYEVKKVRYKPSRSGVARFNG